MLPSVTKEQGSKRRSRLEKARQQIEAAMKEQAAKMQSEIGPEVRKKMEETPQLHDGKWLFIPVETQREVEDIIHLIGVKQNPRPQSVG